MNITEIDKPIIINNILHTFDNVKILDYLFANGKFEIGADDQDPKTKIKNVLSNEVNHAGFYYAPKNESNNFGVLNCPLTMYGFVITNQICKNLEFTYSKIIRIAYNYYCRHQFAGEHTDSKEDNTISIIYNPITTDGGTIILGQKYQDIGSQAKVFNSKWLHSSYSTDKDKARVSLNIVLKI